MSVLVWIGVAALGGVGAVVRYRFDALVQSRVRGAFPVGTLAVNLAGTFALGLLAGAGVAGDALLLAGTAALGSLTTFSTWMLETERLGEDGDDAVALANVGLPAAAGFAAVLAGWLLGGAL